MISIEAMFANLSKNLALALAGGFVLGPKDIADILVITLLIYAILLLVKRTHSFFVLNGLAILAVIYIVARAFNLYLTTFIFQTISGFFVVIMTVVFQKEIRHFFEWLASWRRIIFRRRETDSTSAAIINEIIKTVTRLFHDKVGALIVLTGRQPLDHLLSGGVSVDGRVSSPLLLSIFDISSPGHDGAVIIKGDRVRKFGVHLPLADNFTFENMGTRHRAAMGIAERSDAFVIVVSEERGTVSVGRGRELRPLSKPENLKGELEIFLNENAPVAQTKTWYWFLTRNFREKIMAVALASVLWFIFVVRLGGGIITREFVVPLEFRSVSDSLTVDDVSVSAVTLTLSGSGRDFNLLNPQQLKVVIDIPDFKEGRQKVMMSEGEILIPSPLKLLGFTPRNVQFVLKKAAQ